MSNTNTNTNTNAASATAALLALAETNVLTRIPEAQLHAAFSAPPFYHAQGTFNLRDPALIPSSTRLRPGLVYRSGVLNGLTPAGRATLSGFGIKRVFDLRSREEHAQQGPDPEIEGAEGVWTGAEEKNADVVLSEFVEGEGEAGYANNYLDVLKVHAESAKAVLEHVRDREGEPLLVHCTAGRDRTAVITALLLTLAGESADTIALDYLLSRVGTEPAREMLIKFARQGSGAEAPEDGNISSEKPGFVNLISLRRKCWDAFLSAVERKHGGYEGFVRKELGFSEADIEKIKANLRK